MVAQLFNCIFHKKWWSMFTFLWSVHTPHCLIHRAGTRQGMHQLPMRAFSCCKRCLTEAFRSQLLMSSWNRSLTHASIGSRRSPPWLVSMQLCSWFTCQIEHTKECLIRWLFMNICAHRYRCGRQMPKPFNQQTYFLCPSSCFSPVRGFEWALPVAVGGAAGPADAGQRAAEGGAQAIPLQISHRNARRRSVTMKSCLLFSRKLASQTKRSSSRLVQLEKGIPYVHGDVFLSPADVVPDGSCSANQKPLPTTHLEENEDDFDSKMPWEEWCSTLNIVR